MHSWSPIKLHDEETFSIDDLKSVLDRLAQLDYEDVPVTKTELEDIFDKLADYYYESDKD